MRHSHIALLFILLSTMVACTTTPPVAHDPPLTKPQCEALAHAAYKASSANDAGAAALLMMVARHGRCY